MDLSMQLNYVMDHVLKEKYDISKAAELCRSAGFRYVDYSPDFLRDDWKECAFRDKEILENNGIVVEQTHAPINRYRQYDDDMFWTYYNRLFEASSIVGAKYVVVHADEYRTVDRYDEKEILDFTYDYLAPYVEYASSHGMIVAVENVFEDKNYRWPEINGKSRFTSRVDELLSVIERFSSPDVACCWDFGHAKCAFGKDDMAGALEKVGKYVVCTHVHDNYHNSDLHLVPFLGETDWKANMEMLRRVGYTGKLSFEFAYGSIPDELMKVFLDSVWKTGEYLVGLFDGK